MDRGGPAHSPEISLSIIKTAESKNLEAFFYHGGSWFKSRVAAYSAVLVDHPQGRFLFDSGLGSDARREFKTGVPFWLKPFMSYENHKPAKTQLADKIKKEPVRMIILSHLHWDHASGIRDFPDAEVWTPRQEYDWALGSHAAPGSNLPSEYANSGIRWRFIEFGRVAYENFDRSLDVFQDGSVVLVPLPGHTPGSMGMFINLKSGKRFFFTGDTTWAFEGFENRAPKFWITRLLVDDDPKRIMRSILKVRQLMQAYPEMQIVPAHDDRVQKTLGFFPAFIH